LAKEARGPPTTGLNSTCSDRRSEKNEYSNGMPQSEGRVYTT